MQSLKKAVKELSTLETGSQVGSFLKERGIKGNRGGMLSCPIAVYLQQTTNERVAVGPIQIWIAGEQNSAIKTPIAVKKFIGLFDAGHYPELDRAYLLY